MYSKSLGALRSLGRTAASQTIWGGGGAERVTIYIYIYICIYYSYVYVFINMYEYPFFVYAFTTVPLYDIVYSQPASASGSHALKNKAATPQPAKSSSRPMQAAANNQLKIHLSKATSSCAALYLGR